MLGRMRMLECSCAPVCARAQRHTQHCQVYEDKVRMLKIKSKCCFVV